MPSIEYTLWQDNGNYLKNIKYPKRYLTPEKYDRSKNPLESLVVIPDLEDFFATKVCNIFIVGIPYGWVEGNPWTEEWPPEGYEESKARHIETFSLFSKYETHVFMDFNIVSKVMAANPDSNFEEMMNVTKGHMEEMCGDLSEYGFTMEPDILADVGPEHFYHILDAFYVPTG